MGEDLALFRAGFNGSLRVEARPERLTSEAGAFILREVIERLGITPCLVGGSRTRATRIWSRIRCRS
jgi:hypothetical protein